jgi:hypothetical protein
MALKPGDRVQVKPGVDSVFSGRRGTIKLAARQGYVVKLHAIDGLLYFRTDELEAVKRDEPH